MVAGNFNETARENPEKSGNLETALNAAHSGLALSLVAAIYGIDGTRAMWAMST